MIANSRFRTRALVAAFTLLFVFVTVVAAPPSEAQEFLGVWNKQGMQTLITGPVKANLAYTDQSGKEQVISVDQLTPAQLDGMPEGLAEVGKSQLLRTGFFDQLWSSIKDQVCKDVQINIQRLVNRSPNSSYDIQPCVMNSKSYVIATFNTGWENDQFKQVTGRRLMINMTVPFNGVQFWVTSPHTCHHNGSCNPGQPGDPMFVYAFTANIFIICAPSPTPTINQFALPISCQGKSSIDTYGVFGGDVTGQLKQAAGQLAGTILVQGAGAAATGGASLPEAAASIVAAGVNTLINGIGAGIALLDDQHLRDQVSSALGPMGSGTLNANAASVSTQFNSLFTNLYNAWLGGMRPFAVGIGKGLSLDFGLVYPPPAKPQLKNTIAAQNAGSIIPPSIAVAQPEVLAGQLLPVKASSFRGTYATSIPLSWNKTVLGTPSTAVAYGPPPVSTKTGGLTFDATNLKPLSVYHFSVRECDALSCAPPSDEVTVKTEAGGANEVIFWLDKDIAHPVGTFPAPASGGDFIANVRIPANTAPGPHLLSASIYGRPPATATITVCQAGGCLPSAALVNPANGTVFPPGAGVMVGAQVTLRGAAFAPNGEVMIYLDNLKSQRIATAPVGPVGGFQSSFRMPMVAAGQHKFLVLEAKPGTAPPHLQYNEATVAVFVQAAAQ
jgi:hypothetical protein